MTYSAWGARALAAGFASYAVASVVTEPVAVLVFALAGQALIVAGYALIRRAAHVFGEVHGARVREAGFLIVPAVALTLLILLNVPAFAELDPEALLWTQTIVGNAILIALVAGASLALYELSETLGRVLLIAAVGGSLISAAVAVHAMLGDMDAHALETARIQLGLLRNLPMVLAGIFAAPHANALAQATIHRVREKSDTMIPLQEAVRVTSDLRERGTASPRHPEKEVVDSNRLQLLEDRLLAGDISEDTYLRLRRKYE